MSRLNRSLQEAEDTFGSPFGDGIHRHQYTNFPEDRVDLGFEIRAETAHVSRGDHESRVLPPATEAYHVQTDNQIALRAWSQRFGSAQVHFSRTDPTPFTAGRRLGGGGVGIVHETKLDGIALALKRTYTRKLSDRDLNEFKVLSQMSGKRHKHIIELIGSYVHRQRSGYEVGLLLSPVAHCDLASYLHDVDALQYWIEKGPLLDGLEADRRWDEAKAALETLTSFRSDPLASFLSPYSIEQLIELLLVSKRYIFRSFLCIAEAVAFLHQNMIRHKDLKPSQILLSPHGLWLTDFGWSKDMSMHSRTTTSNGESMTVRYQAPERAARERCSRSEDIFTLGCTFLEMALRVADDTAAIIDSWSSVDGEKWSFQAHLHRYSTWVSPLFSTSTRLANLAIIISRMMRWECDRRPSIESVLDYLSYYVFDKDSQHRQHFHNSCCPPRRSAYTTRYGCEVDMIWPNQEAWLTVKYKSVKKVFWDQHRHLTTAACRSAWSEAIDEIIQNAEMHQLPSAHLLSPLQDAKVKFWKDNSHLSEVQRRHLFREAADNITVIPDDASESTFLMQSCPEHLGPTLAPSATSQQHSYYLSRIPPFGFGEPSNSTLFDSSLLSPVSSSMHTTGWMPDEHVQSVHPSQHDP